MTPSAPYCFHTDTTAAATQLLPFLVGSTLATAESCTGGLLASLFTDIPGSSSFFLGSCVAYANDAKTALLGIPADLIEEHGAVSQPVALAMAAGIAKALAADCAIGITGVAGPGGGSPEKPVGTVWIGWFVKGEVDAELFRLPGDRQQVRGAACIRAIDGLAGRLQRLRG